MAKPATPVDQQTCADLWHSSLSIRQETCPSCGGTAKSDDDALGVALIAEAARDVVEAIKNAVDRSDDDHDGDVVDDD